MRSGQSKFSAILFVSLLFSFTWSNAQNIFPQSGDVILEGNLKMGNSKSIIGGFGAISTGGVQDWNDSTVARSGNSYSLLGPSSLNAPQTGYYHSFTYEYTSKNGTGNLTQFAIPYYYGTANKGYYYRTRYSGAFSPWMRILTENTSGNVGIGTISPAGKLHVVGGAFLEGQSGNKLTLFNQSDGNRAGEIRISGDGDFSNRFLGLGSNSTGYGIQFYNAAKEFARFTSNGNFGLGTQAPGAQLHVAGTTLLQAADGTGHNWLPYTDGSNYFRAENHVFATKSAGVEYARFKDAEIAIGRNGLGGKVFFKRSSDGAQAAGIGMNWSNGGSYGDLLLSSWGGNGTITMNTSGADRFKILSNGNVGINESNPQEKLQIGNSYFFHDGGHKVLGFMFKPSGAVDMSPDHYSSEIRFDPTNGNLRLGTSANLSDGPTTRLTIDKNGDIGIGTLTPQERLEVVGGTLIRNNSGTNGLTVSRATNPDGTSPLINLIADASKVRLRSYGDLTFWTSPLGGAYKEQMRLTETGKLGLGTNVIPEGYLMAVDGKIITEKVVVRNSGNWPDFVFEKNYRLPDLSEVEQYIQENNHLPEIPTASEVENEGQDLAEMNRLLLKKVEELTLYIIEQGKEIKRLHKMDDRLKMLESKMDY